MRTLKLIVLCLIGIPVSLCAQTYQQGTLRLKDGTVLRGEINISKQENTVNIKTIDGDVFYYQLNEVSNIKKMAPIEKGWESSVEISFYQSCPFDRGHNRPSLKFNSGYRFSKTIYTGLGIGIEQIPFYQTSDDQRHTESFTVPLYAQLKVYCLTKNRVNPFISTSVGANVGKETWTYREYGPDDKNGNPIYRVVEENFNVSFFSSFSLGVNFRISNLYSIYLSTGIKRTKGKLNIDTDYKKRVTKTFLGLNLGFVF